MVEGKINDFFDVKGHHSSLLIGTHTHTRYRVPILQMDTLKFP